MDKRMDGWMDGQMNQGSHNTPKPYKYYSTPSGIVWKIIGN